MGAGRPVIEQITLEDLPELAKHLASLKGEDLGDQEGYQLLKQFVVQLDDEVGEWDFTTAIVLRLQKALDEMYAFCEEKWGNERSQTFLRRLAALNELTSEGDEARKHFGSMAAISEAARNHIEREDYPG